MVIVVAAHLQRLLELFLFGRRRLRGQRGAKLKVKVGAGRLVDEGLLGDDVKDCLG